MSWLDRDDDDLIRQAARLQEYARTEWVRTGEAPPFAGRPTRSAREIVTGDVRRKAP